VDISGNHKLGGVTRYMERTGLGSRQTEEEIFLDLRRENGCVK
jgi:hypothetical protein